MNARDAGGAFPLVKEYFELANRHLVVRTYACAERTDGKWVDAEGVCVGRRDHRLMTGPSSVERYWFLYRSKADFAAMLLGCEPPDAAAWRKRMWSPRIEPVAFSVEELEFKLAVLVPGGKAVRPPGPEDFA